jgi:hypothetical protein
MIHASSCILDINVTYSLFSTPFRVLKNIIFLLVVLSLLSCQTHPFLPKYFSDGVVYHSGEDKSAHGSAGY